jgi:hypothetical protein
LPAVAAPSASDLSLADATADANGRELSKPAFRLADKRNQLRQRDPVAFHQTVNDGIDQHLVQPGFRIADPVLFAAIDLAFGLRCWGLP